ncbi:hypothetical protein P3T23_009837, partial [Paraburkholderia sp. GAS448]|uniref:hypothetical protein n=1 Tax=Paraburkholderia sp. GAS448 TaxID=3035136 RepID=UPI003D2196C2
FNNTLRPLHPLPRQHEAARLAKVKLFYQVHLPRSAPWLAQFPACLTLYAMVLAGMGIFLKTGQILCVHLYKRDRSNISDVLLSLKFG